MHKTPLGPDQVITALPSPTVRNIVLREPFPPWLLLTAARIRGRLVVGMLQLSARAPSGLYSGASGGSSTSSVAPRLAVT